MSDLSWLNPTPHAIALYASQPLSPVATQHSLPSGRCSLLGPDFHRLDRTSLPGALILVTFAIRPHVFRRLSRAWRVDPVRRGRLRIFPTNRSGWPHPRLGRRIAVSYPKCGQGYLTDESSLLVSDEAEKIPAQRQLLREASWLRSCRKCSPPTKPMPPVSATRASSQCRLRGVSPSSPAWTPGSTPPSTRALPKATPM